MLPTIVALFLIPIDAIVLEDSHKSGNFPSTIFESIRSLKVTREPIKSLLFLNSSFPSSVSPLMSITASGNSKPSLILTTRSVPPARRRALPLYFKRSSITPSTLSGLKYSNSCAIAIVSSSKIKKRRGNIPLLFKIKNYFTFQAINLPHIDSASMAFARKHPI